MAKSQENKNPVGRPLKFKTEKELQAKIDAYFKDCDPHIETRDVPRGVVVEKKGRGKSFVEVVRAPKRGELPTEYRNFPVPYLTEQKPYTITGLAEFLETTRELLVDYSNRAEFSDTIKKAKLKIHRFWEEALYEEKKAAGVIFNLKNNWRWKDRSEVVDPMKMPTGYEHLSDEELDAEIERLNRQNNQSVPGKGEGAAQG